MVDTDKTPDRKPDEADASPVSTALTASVVEAKDEQTPLPAENAAFVQTAAETPAAVLPDDAPLTDAGSGKTPQDAAAEAQALVEQAPALVDVPAGASPVAAEPQPEEAPPAPVAAPVVVAAAVAPPPPPAAPPRSISQPPRPRGLISRFVPKSPTAAIQPVLAPPPPPVVRPERPFVNFMSGMFSFLLVVGILAAAGVFVADRRIKAPGPLPSDKVVVVRGGAADVTEQLQREGVIDKPMLFLFGLYSTGSSSQIKAGEYLFRREASLGEVMETLVEGKSVLHSISIPEGLTSEQIVERLRDSDVLSGEIREIPREGALLPETYKVTRGMQRSQLLERMSQDQARVIREVWARRSPDLPLKSPLELVILASIVEKESDRADERTRVAGVFVNRLNRNMRLQSDPTIIYGLVGGKGSLGRPITRADIDSRTAYNTYVIPGLPPAPIGNPGRASLEAVANPSRTKDLYFVADGTGGHAFAETLEQHNRNVARWRQVEAERSGGSVSAAVTPAVAPAPAPPPPAATPVASADAGELTPHPDLPKVPPLPPIPPPDLVRGPAPEAVPAAAASAAPRAPRAPVQPGAAPDGFDLNSPKQVPKLD